MAAGIVSRQLSRLRAGMAIGSRYLDLTLPAGRSSRIRILERPGRILAPDELERLVQSLRDLVTRSGIAALDYGVLQGSPAALDRAVLTLIEDIATDRIVAFNALSLLNVDLHGHPVEAVHLGLVVVDPGHRTQGLSWVLYGLTTLLLFVRRGLRPLWISNVTQVPSIVGKVAEGYSNVFPNPFEPTRRSFDHLSVARAILRDHRTVFGVGEDAGFDETRFVVTNAYTGGSNNLKKTWDAAPKHRDARVNALCHAQLDYGRGDDFIQIARFDLLSARRYLLRDVPRASLPAVLGSAAFLLLAGVVLPIVYWFDTRQPYGALRARTSHQDRPGLPR